MFSNLHTMKCTDQMKGFLSEFLSNSLSSKVGVFLNSQSSVELTAQIIVLSFTSLTGSLCSAGEVSYEGPTWAAVLYEAWGLGFTVKSWEVTACSSFICSGPQNSLFPSKRLIPLNLHSVYFGVLHLTQGLLPFQKMDPSGVKVLETAEDIQERRQQVLDRYHRFKELSTLRRQKLEDSYRFQFFQRDAEELEKWIQEKLQIASDENYKDPTNLQVRLRCELKCHYSKFVQR